MTIHVGGGGAWGAGIKYNKKLDSVRKKGLCQGLELEYRVQRTIFQLQTRMIKRSLVLEWEASCK